MLSEEADVFCKKLLVVVAAVELVVLLADLIGFEGGAAAIAPSAPVPAACVCVWDELGMMIIAQRTVSLFQHDE